ncbi:putative bifunctional diguanylate cyclase/phosphodiesterase [Paraburkholderia acidisoli]|uniref:EAL domain-containing protein n=1 Tax=Paraburkholderia acidisoli TaxID=2571748 RepID=A0A7Z2GNV6_9BURK|nr:EAL domain-containing protein [Paraburkholderia acidisoli]QGZ64834.1 EAL domain-containing protein [Paraburkholderia acidisoli]
MLSVLRQLIPRSLRTVLAKEEDAALLLARSRIFTYQLPMMYMLLLVNTWGLVLAHLNDLPVGLGLVCPLVLSGVCVLRMATWLRLRGKPFTLEMARKAVHRTNVLAVVLAASFSAWAISLLPHGGANLRFHVAFYMAITTIGIIFCLIHLLAAALAVTVIVDGAFVVTFLRSGNVTFEAIAIDAALVSVAMLVVFFRHYEHFRELVRAQGENYRLANLDSLTSLPNRRAFFAFLDVAYDTAKEAGRGLAVGIIDLDGFKPINDLHGHAFGDVVLQEVGKRLSPFATQGVAVARLGGDEFAIVVDYDCSEERLRELGRAVCAELSRPFIAGEMAIRVGATVGIAIFSAHSESARALFEHADYALYQGKRRSRGSVVIFSEAHKDAITRGARVAQALQSGDIETEISVAYQPIYSVSRRHTTGFEALARWTSSTLGTVSPAEFIPTAERIGFINELTVILLSKALRDARDWPEHLRLSFNLSAHDLASEDVVKTIGEIIEGSGFDPRRLDFEMTETAMIQDFEQVQRATRALRALGCGISLDDFGTGYSSMSYLCQLPVTRIKIDRAFTKQVCENATALSVVRTLLTLSRQMSLECVVEGVEHAEEMDCVASLGADLIQGFYRSRPLEAHALHAYLESERATSALYA